LFISPALQEVATRDALGALWTLYVAAPEGRVLDWTAGRPNLSVVDDEQARGWIKKLMEQAPDNILALAAIHEFDILEMTPHRALLAQALQKYPNNALLSMVYSHWLRTNNRYAEARQAAEKAARLSPQNSYTWLNLASTTVEQMEFVRRGRVSGTIADKEEEQLSQLYSDWMSAAQRATRRFPESARAWKELAVAATFAGEQTLAEQALNQSVALAPKHYAAYRWALQMYQPKWFDQPQKLQKYVDLVAAEPSRLAYLFPAVVEALESIDDKDRRTLLQAQSMSTFIGLHRRPETEAIGRYRQAFWAGSLKKDGPVIDALTDLTRVQPGNAEAYFRLGLAHGTSDKRRALEMFQTARRLNPYHAEILTWMGDFLQTWGESEEAVKVLSEAVQKRPNDGPTLRSLGIALKDLGRNQEALPYLQKALQLWPDSNSPLFYALSQIYLDRKENARALEVARQALENHPDDSIAHLAVGSVLLKMGKYTEALQSSEKALQGNPTSPLVLLLKGEALLGLKRIPEARQAWEKLIPTASQWQNGEKYATRARQLLEVNPAQ
jgi:tetratricopeptide (TPR) repeat protein